MTIDEILAIDTNDVFYFCTGYSNGNFELYYKYASDFWFKCGADTMLITMDGYIYIENKIKSEIIYRNISDYLVYKRNRKLNTLLE